MSKYVNDINPVQYGGRESVWFPADTMALAKHKADNALKIFRIVGVPCFCFQDHDVRPDGDSMQESHKCLAKMADDRGA